VSRENRVPGKRDRGRLDGNPRPQHLTEGLFQWWMGLVVMSIVWLGGFTIWGPGTALFLAVVPAWGIGWMLFLIVVPLWLEPLKVACRPERLKRGGAWRHAPRRYDWRTLRVLPALVPVVLVGALVILELGYGVFAPAGRRVAPDGLRFGIAAAALVSVPRAFLVSQLARARFRREVEGLGDCFGCGYSLRGIGSGVCPECGAGRGSAP